MALYPNGTASTGQETVGLQSAFNLLNPQLMNVLFQKYGDQYLPFFNLVMTLGEVKPVAGPTFGHYEGSWIHRSFQVQNDVTSPGLGNPQTVQVSSLSVQQSTNTVYPRQFDLVRYSNGVSGTITAVSNPSPGVWNLTIQPQDSTSFTIPAVTAGATIIIDSNVFGEGTDQPEGRNNPGIQYLFATQIIKEAFNITGSAMTDELWYTTDNKGNSAMPYPKGQMEAEYREVLEISQAMLFAVPTNNANINGTTMTGLFPWAQANANSMTITPGTFTVQNFDQLSRVFDKRRASSEYLWAAGPDQFRDVENGLADVFSQNPNILAQQNFASKFSISDGTDYAQKYGVSWNFKSVQKTGRSYFFTTIPQLSGEQMGGAPGYNDSYRALIIPLDKGIDSKTGNKIARLSYRYKEYGGMNRMMRVWEQGGMAKTPTDGFDRVKYNVLHEGGNQPFGPETWGVVIPG